MAADDLNTPLGQDTTKTRRFALPISLPQAVAGVLALFLGAFVLWSLAVDDPFGGEPMVIVSTNQRAAQKASPSETQREPATPGMQAPSRYDGPPPGQAPASDQAAAGNRTVTIIDGTSGKRQEIVLPGGGTARETPAAPRANAAAAPAQAPGGGDQRVLETTRHGAIPRIAADGTQPWEVYARPVKASGPKPEGPRIAIVVNGLGISSASTTDALARLPAPVTFAFAPYGPEIERLVARARSEGREVLLQLPMEPFDYPDNDPGPQTLLSSLPAEQNVDRLHWLMSRFQGYVGVTNYMGARFTASEQAIRPVLRETARRGLIYVDDGTSPRSLASQIAGANNQAFAKADVVIDSVATPLEIDRALSRLEGIARQRGIAVGSTSALPIAIDRISRWLVAAERRGFRLVPISAAATKQRQS